MNIFKHIARLWRRQKRFFIVNVLGLSIGLSVSILLILYVFNELSYDRYFTHKDRIVRLNSIWKENNNEEFMAICLRKAYTELPEQVPGIQNALQIFRGGFVEVKLADSRFQDLNLLYADTSFFSLFDLPAIYGNPAQALQQPNMAIFTQKQAIKVFGPGNPSGKTFTMRNTLFTVGAVIKDIPANTHFQFDILTSMSSYTNLQNLGGLEFFTYYLLNERAEKPKVIASIERNYKAALEKNFSEFSSSFDAKIEKLTELHLYSKANGDLSQQGSIRTIWILSTLALLILLLAITNFINLFLVQGESRSSEIGVRKVNGAGNKAMVSQFFGESAALVILSFVLGFLIVASLLPSFTNLISRKIEISLLYSPSFLICIAVLILIVVFMAGFYPALYLSRLNPVKVLGSGSKVKFRKQKLIIGVVTFQSVITIFLIAVLLIMDRQIDFLKNTPLHYNPNNVMTVFYPSDAIKNHYKAIQDKLKSHPEVVSTGAGQHVIGLGMSGQGLYVYGTSPDKNMSINEYRVMPGSCETFGLELKEGRFFTDSENDKKAIILNEKAVKSLGLSNPIGEKVVMFDDPMEIIGVVKDFYYETTGNEIQPLALTNYINNFYYMYIKFKTGTNRQHALALTSLVFKEFDKDYVLNSKWCDDLNADKYYREDSLSKIVTWSTLLSIIIAMMGLYAIHSYQIMQRTKEIGIRKVLGSSVSDIIYLTTSKSLRWIALAAIIGIPAAYFSAEMWLQNYTNRIHAGVLVFVVPVAIQAIIALLITSAESLRKASRNPVESLRYE